MTPDEIKELIDEIKNSGEEPVVRATLLAQMLQAFYLAKLHEIGERTLVVLHNVSKKL